MTCYYSKLLVTYLLLMLIGCSQHKTINKPESDANLEGFKKLVKENWDYTYERGYVLPNSTFYDLSDWNSRYASELKKLDTTEIKELFGEPRKKVAVRDETHWYYFTNKECIPFDKTYRCKFYVFEFNADGKCKVVVSAARYRNF